jgi:hypothetical protein
MLKLSIPKPCHEDWGSMTPNEQGRHCAVCAKTVTDFTQMSDDEVKLFFLNKKQEERTCGRFTNKQLNQITIALPANIYYIPMPLWKKFLAASLIIFSTTLFSCNTNMKGEPQVENDLTGVIAKPQLVTLLGDTVLPNEYIMLGAPALIDTSKQGTCTKEIITVEGTTVGEIAPLPPEISQGVIQVAPLVIEEKQIDKIKPVKDTSQLKDSTNCNTQKFY